MGLDISNGLFGNFHLNWAATTWFSDWCAANGLPEPFIGWESGSNDGDQCELGSLARHTVLAIQWCEALERKSPDIAQLGKELLDNPPGDLSRYLYPHREGDTQLSESEWRRRALAAWYAILRHGVAHGDTLAYW